MHFAAAIRPGCGRYVIWRASIGQLQFAFEGGQPWRLIHWVKIAMFAQQDRSGKDIL